MKRFWTRIVPIVLLSILGLLALPKAVPAAQQLFVDTLATKLALKSLTIDEAQLTRQFASDIIGYSTVVNSDAIRLRFAAADPEAKILINGAPAVSGQTTKPISLTQGSNWIKVQLSTEDGRISRQYVVNVYRK